MKKIKKGDNVIVKVGRSKGQTGKVLKVLTKSKSPKTGEWVIVEGANLVKEFVKDNPEKGVQGGVFSREAAMHISNIAHVDPKTGKPTKVGIKTLEDGRKVRFLKSSGEVVNV